MLPRFVNPHLTSITSKKTSRAVVFQEDLNSDIELDNEHQLLLKNLLHKRICDSLDIVVEVSRKRRKISDKKLALEPILFNLVSSEEPRLININPPPPKPPPHYREPTYEDTEKDASKRREYSKAIAVDYDWVIAESKKTYLPFPSWKSRVTHATCSPISESPAAAPPLLVLEYLQPVRHTRPPVPDDLLTHHPYTTDTSLHPEAQNRKKPQSTIPIREVTLQS
ncbi:hypothetical protein J3R30DRAFT_3715014 [Lentinula aciculospora]|uniref:Uncharacterized protein n=1 Tax=Lentinula aciculospora TaxID=153920 RepID=A0A9W9DGC4_9AGAR|nr:hypothetical protein J3R30DRAFT_3715014 [Lentinula aciculospora]